MNRTSRIAMTLIMAWVLGAYLHAAAGQTRAQLEKARLAMVQDIIIGSGVSDPRVVQAMRDTPRHEFVSLAHRKKAYFDMSLPIGARQTISSPFIVSYMTQSLDPQPSDKVLEIGTGSGYQAAVLSPLADQVYTIEIVEFLGRRAERTLKRLKYKNVHVMVGDGFKGWPEHAPFDKIIVTCSPEKIPQPLVDQLKEGGRMVIPVGERYQQTLYLLKKTGGKLITEALRPTLFVPMTGRAEASRDVKPDPLHPTAVNGTFERGPTAKDHIPGWYYQRQTHWETDILAPEGDHYVTFHNRQGGRSSHALQGFAIDGRQISQLEISAHIKAEDVVVGPKGDMLPAVAVSFYDENRRELGHQWLGPWRGTFAWHKESKKLRVPLLAREGILRIGLFGATGQISLDEVRMKAIKR